jgi:hypothetical protein
VVERQPKGLFGLFLDTDVWVWALDGDTKRIGRRYSYRSAFITETFVARRAGT